MRRSPFPGLLLLLISAPAFSDGGMWTFHDFPAPLVRREHGVDITSGWLDRVRTATIRLSNCTASFVSPDGLILTNHHCSEACLDDNSTPTRNLVRDGFLAHSREEELKCGTQIADVLMDMENVTAKVTAALQGLSDKDANTARKKTLTQLEQACEEESKQGKFGPLKCESVNLYQGGQYWLYKYHRYDDVRLVFAPERGIAAFGGDPDNFQFPRWCLDMSVPTADRPRHRTSCTSVPAGRMQATWCSSPAILDRPIGCSPCRSSRTCATSACRAGCCAPRSCAAVTSSSARRTRRRTASPKTR